MPHSTDQLIARLRQNPEDVQAFRALRGEYEQRQDYARRMLPFHVPFLDDILRGILPHDLILLGAETGAGKTQMAAIIAQQNAMAGKRVVYLALEAEPLEIERRIKYRLLMELVAEARDPAGYGMNYADWYIGNYPEVDDRYGPAADRIFAEKFSTLRTFYRDRKFTAEDISRVFLAIQNDTDLIVLDHLHYVDSEESDENKAQRRIIMAIRDASLMIGVPVLCIAHLRKKDLKSKAIVPHAADFHGSSELTKVVTRGVVLARAKDQPAKSWNLSPTYIHAIKNRLSGWSPWVAVADFNIESNGYCADYTLGKMTPSREEFEAVPDRGAPRWARNAEARQQYGQA